MERLAITSFIFSLIHLLSPSLIAEGHAPVHHERSMARELKPLGKSPFLIVHGWGETAADFDTYKDFLIKSGVPSDRIHVLEYDHMKSLDEISQDLSLQLKEVLSLYEARQNFQMIGHSLGQFVGLMAMLEAGASHRFSKFVGLVGIAHGLDSFIKCQGIITHKPKDCGGIRELIPFNNDFIKRFYKKYAKEISALSRCSLSSPQDWIIKSNPLSGFFDDGKNVTIEATPISSPLHWKRDIHFKVIQEEKYFDLMLRECIESTS